MAEVIRNMIAILETSLAVQPSREAPQTDERPDADAFGQVFENGQVLESPPDPNEAFVGVPPLSMRSILDVATTASGSTVVPETSQIVVAQGQVETGLQEDGSGIPASAMAADGPDIAAQMSPQPMLELAVDDVSALSDADQDSQPGQVAAFGTVAKASAAATPQIPIDAAVKLAGVPGFTAPKPAVLPAPLGKDMQIKAKELQDERDLSHGGPTRDSETPLGFAMYRLVANASSATSAWSNPAYRLGARQGQTDPTLDPMEQAGPFSDSSADMTVLAHSSVAGGRFGDVPMSPAGASLSQQIAMPLLSAAAQSPGQQGQIEVILSPQELGPVRLEFRSDGDKIHVLLATERPETLELMRRHGDALVAELRQAGYAGASLSFGHWGQSHRGARPTPMSAFAIAPMDSATDLPIPLPTRPSAQSGELDLRF
jgi:Flagellar hook-length control protein FliK